MLQTIQAGRGIAALAVAAFHLSLTMGVDRYGGQEVFRSATRFGKLGVIFFFVLSGFIILHAHFRDIGSPDALRNYATKRFVRLYPAYWVYTAGFVALVLLGVGVSGQRLPDSAAGWLTAVTLVWLSPESPPLGVAWTLIHEVLFYALFAVLIVSKRVGLAVLLAWAVVSVALYSPDGHDTTAFEIYTASYNLAFMLGMGAYWIYRTGRFSRAAIVGGLAVAGVSVWSAYRGWAHFQIAFAVGCAFAIGGAAALEKMHGFGVPSVLRKMGDASYTLYLTHIHLQTLALKVLIATGVAKALGPQGTYVLTFLLCAIGGYAVYRQVEEPLLKLCRTFLPGSR